MGGQSTTAANKIGPNTGNRGRGRPKGAPNKTTREVKEMILVALGKAGGAEYLLKQSKQNPTAFMTLVGKVLPMQVTGEDGGAIQVIIKKPESADA